MKDINKKDILKVATDTLNKEISALNNIENIISKKDFSDIINLLRNRKGKIVVTGIGKSAFVGMKISATFISLGHESVFLHPVDALHGDSGIIKKNDIILALSSSGETKEIINLIIFLKKAFKIQVLAITNKKGSALFKISDFNIVLDIKDEGCFLGIAPMASATATLVVGDVLASVMTSFATFTKKHFLKFHPGGGLNLELKQVKDIMLTKKLIPIINHNSNFKETLREISKKNFGITAVIDKYKTLIGVITDGDIRRFLLDRSNLDNIKASDLMSLNPKSISKNSSLKEALDKMEKFKITVLFVCDEKNKILGIVHMHNILEIGLV